MRDAESLERTHSIQRLSDSETGACLIARFILHNSTMDSSRRPLNAEGRKQPANL